MKALKTTDDQLREAVKSSSSMNQVLEKLGYSLKSRGSRVSVRIRQLLIDTTHFTTKKRWNNEQLSEAVANSESMRQVLDKLGYSKYGGGAYTYIKGFIKKLGLDTGHFTGQGHLKGKTHNWSKAISLDEIMVKNSTYTGSKLRRRLIKLGILINKCYECGLPPEWNGKPITLHMDHINGDHHDNRLDNLRILCPNCHAQTPTFGSKRLKKYKFSDAKKPKEARVKPPTPSELNPNWRNRPRPNTRKTEWPSKEELLKLLWEIPTTKIAEQFGVSDKAVEKWAKLYGIEKPPRGYWAKQAANERQCC